MELVPQPQHSRGPHHPSAQGARSPHQGKERHRKPGKLEKSLLSFKLKFHPGEMTDLGTKSKGKLSTLLSAAGLHGGRGRAATGVKPTGRARASDPSWLLKSRTSPAHLDGDRGDTGRGDKSWRATGWGWGEPQDGEEGPHLHPAGAPLLPPSRGVERWWSFS